jgi:hypothetical protein
MSEQMPEVNETVDETVDVVASGLATGNNAPEAAATWIHRNPYQPR